MIPRYIIVHHTGAEEKNAGQVRRYHLSLGWRDVGYNFIIERQGRVVEGRSPGIPGAHCRAGGMNRCSIGVVVIGNLDERYPYPEQWRALLDLLQRLVRRYQVPGERVLGHKEVPGAATACPGRFMDLDALRRSLDSRRKASRPDIAGDGGRHDAAVVQQKPASVLWRVQAGAFRSRAAAERQAARLQQAGIEASVLKGN